MGGNQQNSRLLLDGGFCGMIAMAGLNSFSFSILKMERANKVNHSVCMRNTNMADKNIQKQNEQVETQVPCVVQMVGVEIRSTLKR